MRVALYQCPPLPLDPAANLHRLHQVAMEAKGADLLVLPEMFLTGYNIGAEAVSTLAEVYNGEWAQQIGRIAKSHVHAIAAERGAQLTCIADDECAPIAIGVGNELVGVPGV